MKAGRADVPQPNLKRYCGNMQTPDLPQDVGTARHLAAICIIRLPPHI
jgi:hypothetical protein